MRFGAISFSIQAANLPGADAAPLSNNEDETMDATAEGVDSSEDPQATLAFVQSAVAANLGALSIPRDGEGQLPVVFAPFKA